MELFGIKFVPLNTPLRERLQVVGASAILFLSVSLILLGYGSVYYVIVHTNYGGLGWLYLVWIFLIDRNPIRHESRRSEWVRSWKLWKYASEYFPITLTKLPQAKFDPKRNYILASFPHGVYPNGCVIAFGTNACDQKQMFPDHKLSVVILSQYYKIPILREFFLALGFCSAKQSYLRTILKQPPGGRMTALFVGGVEEALNAHTGTYTIVLRKRKGFIRLALQTGSPLVPVFSFGENDVYSQLKNENGSWLRTIQTFVKQKIGMACIPLNGRGFFQYNFGIIPRQSPITVVVGEPIDVRKIEHPSQEEINALHLVFTEKLVELFETNKYKYVKNPKETNLVII